MSTTDPSSSRPLGPILRRMAVDGLVTWEGSGVERQVLWEDFEQVGAIRGTRVYRRKSWPTPRVQAVRRALLASSPRKISPSKSVTLPLSGPSAGYAS